MASLRYLAVAALVSSVTGFALGAMPSQTIAGGFGQQFHEIRPTSAPSAELVKKQLQKKALTNVCSEWTIPGGFGQPQCTDSQTCLFQTISGNLYEGCGQTSVSYDWITACWDYPQSGIAPKSEIFCEADEPYCGYFGFDFGSGYTFYNFGCSTVSYGLMVSRIATGTDTDTGIISDLTATDSDFLDTATETSDFTATRTSPSTTPTIIVVPGSSTNTSNPTTSSTKRSKAPIGAIVGGVIGGVAVLAFLAFLLWFCLRKRKQQRTASQETQAQVQTEQAAALTAYNLNSQNNNANHIPEIGGTMKPAAAYASPPAQHAYPEKQAAGVGMQEVYRPSLAPQQSSSYSTSPAQVDGNLSAISQSPPPIYTTPSSTLIPSPPSQFSELDQGEGRRTSTGPVSPMGSGLGRAQSPPLQTHGETMELGGENRGSWNAPPGVQEMSAGNATGGISRRPIGGGNARGNFDLSGAPMSEEYRHELQ